MIQPLSSCASCTSYPNWSWFWEAEPATLASYWEDGDEDAEWSDSEEDDFIDNEGKSYESNTKIDIAIRMMQ